MVSLFNHESYIIHVATDLGISTVQKRDAGVKESLRTLQFFQMVSSSSDDFRQIASFFGSVLRTHAPTHTHTQIYTLHM